MDKWKGMLNHTSEHDWTSIFTPFAQARTVEVIKNRTEAWGQT